MRGMESCNARTRQPLWLAVVISLLLHAAALLIDFSSPGPTSGAAANPGSMARPPLLATIIRPVVPPSPRREAAQSRTIRKQAKRAEQRILTAPDGVWADRSWSTAERTDMDKFLNELT